MKKKKKNKNKNKKNNQAKKSNQQQVKDVATPEDMQNFEKIFNEIKEEKKEEKREEKIEREKKIQKMMDTRSEQLNQKLIDASLVDENVHLQDGKLEITEEKEDKKDTEKDTREEANQEEKNGEIKKENKGDSKVCAVPVAKVTKVKARKTVSPKVVKTKVVAVSTKPKKVPVQLPENEQEPIKASEPIAEQTPEKPIVNKDVSEVMSMLISAEEKNQTVYKESLDDEKTPEQVDRKKTDKEISALEAISKDTKAVIEDIQKTINRATNKAKQEIKKSSSPQSNKNKEKKQRKSSNTENTKQAEKQKKTSKSKPKEKVNQKSNGEETLEPTPKKEIKTNEDKLPSKKETVSPKPEKKEKVKTEKAVKEKEKQVKKEAQNNKKEQEEKKQPTPKKIEEEEQIRRHAFENAYRNIFKEDYKGVIEVSASIYSDTENAKGIYIDGVEFGKIFMAECEANFSNNTEKKSLINYARKTLSNVKRDNMTQRWATAENAVFGENKEDLSSQFSLPEIKDYTTEEEAAGIDFSLFNNKRKILTRLVIMFVILVVSVVLLFVNNVDANLSGNPTYLCIQLALLILAIITCKATIISGINAIFRFKFNSDSALSFAAIITLVQSVLVLLFQSTTTDSSLAGTSYAVIPIFGLFLNMCGKFLIVSRIFSNFKFVKSNEKKYSVQTTHRKARTKKEKQSNTNFEVVAYQRKTGFLRNFLKYSYQPDVSEKTLGKLTFIGIGVTIAVFLISFILKGNALQAFSTATLVACAFVPMCCVLVTNLSFYTLCKKNLKKGAMIVGYPAVANYSNVNQVVLRDVDLFNPKLVILHGIKVFNNYSIEALAVETSAIFKHMGSPLKFALENAIHSKENPEKFNVQKCVYHEKLGVEAYLRGKKFLIGTRDLLINNNIAPPSIDIEQGYLNAGRNVSYVAVDGKLCGMLIISYKPSLEMINSLQKLEDNGVKLNIISRDPNITVKMIGDKYKLLCKNVNVISSKDVSKFISGNPSKEDEALLATNGTATSFVSAILSCVRAKGNTDITTATQTIVVFLSVIMVIIASIGASSGVLNAFDMFVVEVILSLVILIISWVRRI